MHPIRPALALVILAGIASAQPANDSCHDAVFLDSGIPAPGTTANANLEIDLTGACPVDAVSDVWYAFSAPDAGAYTITLAGQNNFDLSLAVVTGCEFPIGITACDLSAAGEPISVDVSAFFPGEVLYIRVGSLSGAAQTITVTAGPTPPPANDECSGALPLTLGVPFPSSNLSATTSFGLTDPFLCSTFAPAFAGEADVFFSFTPGFTGFYDFTTCGSDLDTIISIHSDCPASDANVIACNDNAALRYCDSNFSSYLAGAELTAGTTYYIRVATVPFDIGVEPGRGTFDILVLSGQPRDIPANDTCANAEPLSPDTYTPGSSVHDLTGSFGPCGTDDYWDVWYSFTAPPAPSRRIFDFMVSDSFFFNQTTLSLYDSCSDAPITCQIYGPFTIPQISMSAALEPGQTVYLRLAGMLGTQDDFEIVALTGPDAPDNIDCAGAEALAPNSPVLVDPTLAPTTDETDCGGHGLGALDIYPLWYSFSAPSTGYFRFSVVPFGEFDLPALSIFSSCGGDPIVCTTEADSLATEPNEVGTVLRLQNGQDVSIRAALTNAGRGQFMLMAEGPLPPPPPVDNDTCADAQPISSLPFIDSIDITLATPDLDVCTSPGNPPAAALGGIWYTYTPATDCVFRGAAMSASREGHVSVFTGSCGNLTQIGCPNSPVSNPIPLQAGTTYYILASVSPTFSDPDNLEITYGTHIDVTFECFPHPANDHCNTARRIHSPTATFSDDNFAADHEAFTASCAGLDVFANTLWYTFSTRTAGTLTFTGASGFSYLPAAALYSGSCGSLTEIACDDPTSGFFLTDNFTLSADLEACETYYIAVGAWREPEGGPADFSFTYTGELTCPADLTGSSDPNDPTYGRPDCAADASDFFYYLDQFSANNLTIADLTGSSDPNDPTYGIPNGAIDASDFFYYLDLFTAGCP